MISMLGSLVAAFWMSRVRLSALRKCACSGWVRACVMGVLWLVGVMVISVNGLVSRGWVMVREWRDWGLVWMYALVRLVGLVLGLVAGVW